MKPPFCKPQAYKPNEREFLKKIRDQWLSFGIIKKSERPTTCCRITVATKGKDDIRVCYDGRPVNARSVSISTHYTDRTKMVEKASSKRF